MFGCEPESSLKILVGLIDFIAGFFFDCQVVHCDAHTSKPFCVLAIILSNALVSKEQCKLGLTFSECLLSVLKGLIMDAHL
jgi:hypothetical protein